MQKTNLSLAKRGMNRSTHPSQLEQQEYTFALNSNLEDLGGDTFALTNEHSNILASKIKSGYKVVGYKNDINLNKTFFFLTNPDTKLSEFGYILNTKNIQDVTDVEVQCDTCDYKNILSDPLEGQIQVPYQSYVTLLADCPDNLCFNLSVLHPIKKIEIKKEKGNTIIVFTDNFNPPRYIQLDHLEIYSYTGEEVCSDDSNVVDTCLACEKMKIFKDFEVPQITPESIILGGRLRMGTYQFLIAYTDELGNEISEYYSVTNPIRIFDQNNNTLQQENLADRTNFSIKLNVTGLDRDYTHYKVAVIQIADINNAVSYFVEGVHPINDTTVIYSGEENKERTDISKLIRQNIFVKRWEGLTQSNNYLFGYGIEVEKEINLQPVVNFAGQFFKWQASIAGEDLYKDGTASALFLGYNRDEVVPLGIRFYNTNGYRTSIFPIPGRLPEANDLLEVSPVSQDRLSIESNLSDCVGNERTKRWQLYNDATFEGFCSFTNIPTIPTQETVTKICYIDTDSSTNGSFTVELSTPFTTLQDYILDNKDNCPEAFTGSNLCALLNVSNYPEDCSENLFENNCSEAELIAEEIEIVSGSIKGENFQGIEKIFPEEYSKLKKPDYCTIFKTDYTTGKPVRNEDFEYMYGYYPPGRRKFIERDYNFGNEECSYSEAIVNLSSNSTAPSYFLNYIGGETISDLETNKNSTCTVTSPATTFSNKIHKGGLWFKGNTENRTSFILEVSKLNNVGDKDQIITGSNNPDQDVRFSLFNKCTDNDALHCEIFSIKSRGLEYKIDIIDGGFNLTREVSGTVVTSFISVANLFPGGNFYVVIDAAITQAQGISEDELEDPMSGTITAKYRTAPPDGCFSLATKDIEFSGATISWESIEFRKKSTYSSVCTYEQPIIQKCNAIPFKYGKFAYYESQENYPDNGELYNSQLMNISIDDIPDDFKDEFESAFVDSITGEGVYVLKDAANLACKPIRHFRFPDNKVSPFMYENQQSSFNQSAIYPLGITIDENVINMLLDLAVKNNLISQQQRDLIVKYEIVRGDISNDRSIQASGLLYDARKYVEDGKDIFYSNYPFNDLGKDRLNLDSATELIDSNSKYTFHSPETDYYKQTAPTEMSVQGYMFGKSRGVVDEVKEHPKWVILSNKAKELANLLAGLEVASEIALKIAQSAETWRFYGGFVVSLNPVGFAFNIAVSVLATAEAVVSSFGKYRYEWLKIFRDLGQPQNFAAYYYAEGYYNYFKDYQEEGQLLRALNIAKRIKSNKSVVIDETIGERITVNNIDREDSLFLSTGQFPIVYSDLYKNYDNNSINFNNASMTFASENGQCSTEDGKTKTKSGDILRNIASPYVALKNFIPSQYGNINSIKWLPTGYIGDLRSPKDSCVSIFGGDTFIARHTLKRKIPFFLTDAMDLATLTPFNYSFYSNIGRNPRFFADYELNKDFEKKSSLFPDLDSDYRFDCYKKSGNYIVPPSKFYLYSYGVPSFLTETRINTNFRYGKPELGKSFYPEVGDIGDWTQEKNVSIKTPNYFYYNEVYSRKGFALGIRTLPDNFSKAVYDVTYDKPNGIMYSLPDNEENNLNEPWLIYRPFDFYEFPTSYGKLIDVKGIENSQVFVRLENRAAIYNAVDVTVETGQPVTNLGLGNGGIFARRPVVFFETDLGYMGSQTTEMVSSEFGHFFVDAQRGNVFKLNPGGKDVEEISSYVNGKPTGMSHWFKEHLPFKILNSGIEGIDTDNALNGVGIAMGWDSRFKRVFITKRDYIPTPGNCIEYDEELGFVINETECDGIPQNVVCPEGYSYNVEEDVCEKILDLSICPDGYTYNNDTNLCEKNTDSQLCATGFVYNPSTMICEKITTYPANCEEETCPETFSNMTINIDKGDSFIIELNPQNQNTVFTWSITGGTVLPISNTAPGTNTGNTTIVSYLTNNGQDNSDTIFTFNVSSPDCEETTTFTVHIVSTPGLVTPSTAKTALFYTGARADASAPYSDWTADTAEEIKCETCAESADGSFCQENYLQVYCFNSALVGEKIRQRVFNPTLNAYTYPVWNITGRYYTHARPWHPVFAVADFNAHKVWEVVNGTIMSITNLNTLPACP